MKKLIVLLVFGIFVNISPINSQSIVNPIGDNEISRFNLDPRAHHIVLTSASTHQVMFFSTVQEFNSALSDLESGRYILEYNIGEERHRITFIIKNSSKN